MEDRRSSVTLLNDEAEASSNLTQDIGLVSAESITIPNVGCSRIGLKICLQPKISGPSDQEILSSPGPTTTTGTI